MRLNGQVGVVTGGGRGIGASIAGALAREGMAVAVSSRTTSQISDIVSGIEAEGGRAISVTGDISNPADVEKTMSRVVDELGPIDLLVNNAGRGPKVFGPLWECDTEDWWQVLRVNLFGPVLACRAVLPAMVARNAGRVVSIGSLSGGRPWADGSAYAVSKAGLMRLTDCLDVALDGTGVRVFELNPGLVRTPMVEEHIYLFADVPDEDFMSPEIAAAAVVRIAVGDLDDLHGRILDAEDPFDDMVAKADVLREIEARTLRVRTFGDQDPLGRS